VIAALLAHQPAGREHLIIVCNLWHLTLAQSLVDKLEECVRSIPSIVNQIGPAINPTSHFVNPSFSQAVRGGGNHSCGYAAWPTWCFNRPRQRWRAAGGRKGGATLLAEAVFIRISHATIRTKHVSPPPVPK
jgi:hypothetical protein